MLFGQTLVDYPKNPVIVQTILVFNSILSVLLKPVLVAVVGCINPPIYLYDNLIASFHFFWPKVYSSVLPIFLVLQVMSGWVEVSARIFHDGEFTTLQLSTT